MLPGLVASTRGRTVLRPSSTARSSAVSLFLHLHTSHSYAKSVRPRILPCLESLLPNLSATTSSIFQSIQHPLKSNLLPKHIPKHLPKHHPPKHIPKRLPKHLQPTYPRSKYIHRGKSSAIWQALSLLQQALLQALFAVGYEADREVGQAGGRELVAVVDLTSTTAGGQASTPWRAWKGWAMWLRSWSGIFRHEEHDVIQASIDSRQ